MTPAAVSVVPVLLFDLDGTLADSAPDLAGAANDMRLARGLPAIPLAALRPHAGSGARGMLARAFDCHPGQMAYEAMREEFLQRYEQQMLRHSQLFAAVPGLLDVLDTCQLPWGIVTNKAIRLAQPLASALGLWPRARVLVAGDTTPHTKPHPAPLLEAARCMGVAAQRCIYIGDDLRDVQAARGAGMGALAAAWGYLGPDADPHAWAADAVLPDPGALLQFLELA
jgi:N-acetyl-D-muramate 6-phosphate phosphatase